MKQILFLCDNPLVGDIYSVFLNAYVDAEVISQATLEEGKNWLEKGPDVHLIMALSQIEEESIVSELKKISQNKSIPIIFIGKDQGHEVDDLVIENKYDMKTMIRACAKVFHVTAKEMAEKNVPLYFPIPVRLFKDIQRTVCAVYRCHFQDEGESYEKLWDKGRVQQEKIRQVYEQEIPFLYVPADDRLAFINDNFIMILARLNAIDNLSSQEQLKAVEEGMELISSKISDLPEVQEDLRVISQACIKAIKKVIHDNPKLKDLLTGLLKNKSKYIYTHAVLGSYVCSHIIEAMDWGGKEQMDKLSFVLFFHDIFLVPISIKYPELNTEESMLFSKLLTDEEKDVVLNHAKMSGELLRTFKSLPIGADTIATQHHGVHNGMGFAVDYKDDVSPLAKVIIVAEEFVARYLELVYRGRPNDFNLEESLKQMEEKFQKASYRKLLAPLKDVQF